MWWLKFYNKFQRNETTIIVKFVILIWSPNFNKWETAPLGNGQDELFNKKCDYKNCYFTADRKYFGGSLKEFDAIIFSGIARYNERWYVKHLPEQRYPHQKYVFISSEPADYYPLCSKSFDNFFNWTYTYKLDSDCVLYYIRMENKEGKVIYPKKDMHWVNATKDVSNDFKQKLKTKSKAVAWFVSHCDTKSKRREVYLQLKHELFKHKLTIDVFGKCGKFKCSNVLNYRDCYNMLEKDYFFYLAFENSLCEDYVSEKVLHAFLNKVVPIVYGGANYSRFLPPGSYIDMRAHSLKQVVHAIKNAITNPDLYASYFKWTNHYRFLNNGSGITYGDVDINICEFCKLMNDKQKFASYSTYKNMRSWWLPRYKERCGINVYI